jgi:AraC-like DNA-binding protein
MFQGRKGKIMRNAPHRGIASGARRASVAAGFVTGMLSALEARGVDRKALLAQAAIDPAALQAPGARVPIDNYVALYNVVVQALDDEAFGLFGTPARSGMLEFLGRSVLSSRTLGEVLQRAARFLHLVVPDLRIALRAGPGSVELCIAEQRRLQARADDPRRVFAFEWMLRLVHGLACWMVNRDVALQRVVFPYSRPPHAADYDLIYTPRSVFDGTQLVATLDTNLLELPVRRDDRALEQFLEGGPGKIAALYRRDRQMVHRVRALVARAFPDPVALAAVARELNLSTRTLHRRLQAEHSSLRAIKDALRRDQALAQLGKTAKPIARISAELGYADPSAFFRAFTSWTGLSPSAYRRRLGDRAPGASGR